ncbi:MAG: hypothetical protein Q9175_006272 [Cornicularia normoerica]
MPPSDFSSLLAVVDPSGDDAQAAFRFSENAKCRHLGRARDGFGRARDASTDNDDGTSSEVDLSSQMIDPDKAAVHIALNFDPGPKDVSKGFVFGSDQETCDVLLAKDNTSGVSGNHFSISVDWRIGYPLITCLTPSHGTGIRILSGDFWVLYLRNAWKLAEPGVTTIKISEEMKLLVLNPTWENRELSYNRNLQTYFKRCQDATPEMIHLRLYDPEPTPLLVSRGRGLSDTEYLTTSTSFGEKVVLCEAKDRHEWEEEPETSETFIVKRFRIVQKTWPRQARGALRKLCKLQHRHIISPEDIITDSTEYMPVYLPEPPETLADRHIRAPLSEIDVGEVLAQVFEGLKFLHANAIIHGSVYPGNIRIKHSDPWSIQLSDIGLHPYVDLENPKERRLYASNGKSGAWYPLPVHDTWSAGVVGLNLLFPGGLPPRPATRQRRYASSSWTRILAERAAAFYANERPGPGGKKDAAHFLTRVLRLEYSERLTAEECLQHPWIQHRRLPISYDREYSADPNDQLLAAYSEAGPVHEEAGHQVCEYEEGDEESEYYTAAEFEEAEDEEAEEDERSGDDTETEAPPASTSKGKQPQTPHNTSVASSSCRGPKTKWWVG